MGAPIEHLTADFTDVTGDQLRDGATLSGLMIAAAGAAGLTPMGAPVHRAAPGGGAAVVLVLDGGHIAVHTHPARALLLLDILAGSGADLRKALEVFTRRLAGAGVRTAVQRRG